MAISVSKQLGYGSYLSYYSANFHFSGPNRRQTVGPDNLTFCRPRRMTFDFYDETASTSSEIYNITPAQTKQSNSNCIQDDQPTTDDDLESEFLFAEHEDGKSNFPTTILIPGPLINLGDDNGSVNHSLISTPTPTTIQPSAPNLMINSHTFCFKSDSVDFVESKSSEAIMRKNENQSKDNLQNHRLGPGHALGRRNSDCPTSPMLLLPERMSWCDETTCSIQATIIRTSSERTFCVSPVVSSHV